VKKADEVFNRWDVERLLIFAIADHVAQGNLARRWNLISAVNQGQTTFEIRRERIRKLILHHDIADRVTQFDGVEETYAAFYRRFYGATVQTVSTGGIENVEEKKPANSRSTRSKARKQHLDDDADARAERHDAAKVVQPDDDDQQSGAVQLPA
jgi:hypothetical protein